METLAGDTGDSMRRLIVIPAMAVLGLSALPLFPIQSPPIHAPLPHQVMAAPVMPPQTGETAAITSERVEPTPTPTPQPVIAPKLISGSKTDWMAAAGIPESDWQYVDYIVSRESGWQPCAYYPGQNDCSANPSTACGLAQSLPCGKQSKYGQWTDPVANLKWQYDYVRSRYGSYYAAYQYWLVHHNY